MQDAILALEDGTVFYGRAFGARGERAGEVVFNTGMTGYQEVLTDPSYRGQIVAMTAPHIGNTGINDEDPESDALHLAGFAVRALSPEVSNWRARGRLEDYLAARDVAGITEVDTRALTRHLRHHGAMRGVIVTGRPDAAYAVEQARRSPLLVERDLVREVTCRSPYRWPRDGREAAGELHVVAYDFGLKHNQLRRLCARGCRVTVVPAGFPAADVPRLAPDGLFLSNGPGDPAALPYAVANIRALLGRVPIFGICLGHQLLGLALGGRTYKLKFGHHGANQPVKNLLTGQVEITTHNHGFAVDPDSLPAEVEVTHINLNDGCNEGFRHRAVPAFSVQYHPEAAPGPHDADPLFDQFVALMSNA